MRKLFIILTLVLSLQAFAQNAIDKHCSGNINCIGQHECCMKENSTHCGNLSHNEDNKTYTINFFTNRINTSPLIYENINMANGENKTLIINGLTLQRNQRALLTLNAKNTDYGHTIKEYVCEASEYTICDTLELWTELDGEHAITINVEDIAVETGIATTAPQDNQYRESTSSTPIVRSQAANSDSSHVRNIYKKGDNNEEQAITNVESASNDNNVSTSRELLAEDSIESATDTTFIAKNEEKTLVEAPQKQDYNNWYIYLAFAITLLTGLILCNRYLYGIFTSRNAKLKNLDKEIIAVWKEMSLQDNINHKTPKQATRQEEVIVYDNSQCDKALTTFGQQTAIACESLRTTITQLQSVIDDTTTFSKRKALIDAKNELQRFTDNNLAANLFCKFEELHEGFSKRLSDNIPQITDTDLPICALIYLGLTTKEIAALTGKEIRTIESSRNRLRKKIGLNDGEDIQLYLINTEKA